MKVYLELCQRIIDEGVWIENERTCKRCLTVINPDIKSLEDLETWVTADDFELVGYQHHPANR